MYKIGRIVRIIGYIRVSTDQQVESGLGLQAQKNAITEYATKMNAHECEIFSDEGFSGSLALDKRPGMLEAIGALKKGSILVVAKRDRIGRDPLVMAMIESAVKRKGAKIISTAGEGTETDDPSSIFMRRLVDAFGEYERLIIGTRTKAALKIKKDKGQRVGHIPFGKKLADDGIHLEPNHDEVEILHVMSKLKAKNIPIRTIAKSMNSNEQFNRGAVWNHASVHRMLKAL
jgi:DNA invertase Pin-like site-specific DNA recombinase